MSLNTSLRAELFNPILTSNSIRPPTKKSKIVAHVEKDKKNKRQENENFKVDPLSLLSPEEINEMAQYALEMYQTSLKKCSSESNFQAIARNIARLNLGKYYDETFKPNLQTLVGDNLINRTPWRAFVWLLPPQFLGDVDPTLFGKNFTPSPDDPRQGLIGDGYLIASLAAVAEQPHRIVKLFTGIVKDNPMFGKEHGVTGITIYSGGHPYEVVIDDYFPCISEKKGPAFAKVIDGKLWVAMIEKVWAKTYLSYDNIEGGLAKNALRDLTGAPVISLWTDEKLDYLWSELIRGKEKKFPMTTSTKKFHDEIDFINEFGLISDHTYSCLGGYEVKTNKGAVKLIKIRSVYPDAIWKGKWSIESESNEWDSVPDREKYLSDVKLNKMLFFIEFSDFQQYFETVQFCYVNDDFIYSFQTEKVNRKKGQYFKVTIKEEGEYFFTVSQEAQRKYSKAYREKYDRTYLTIVVGRKVGEHQYEYVASMRSDQKDVFARSANGQEIAPKLPAGEYIVYVKARWPAFEEADITLSVYGPAKARIDEEFEFVHKDFLENVFIDHATKYADNKISLDKEGAPESEYCAFKSTHGFGYIAVWNRESNKKLKCEFRVKKMKELSMRFKEKFSGQEVAEFVVMPRKVGICLVGVKKYGEFGDESNTNLYHSKNIKPEYV